MRRAMSILAALCIAGPISAICTQTLSLPDWLAITTGVALGFGFTIMFMRLEVR